MKNLKIAAAVAVAMAASSAAFALDQATTAAIIAAPNAATDVILTVAGASAARNSVGLELSPFKEDGTTVNPTALCQNVTAPNARFDVFRSTGGRDFRAYSCTLITNVATSGANTNLNGKRAVIFYRSEGGSVWGPLSLVSNQMCDTTGGITTQCATGGFNTIKRLNVAGCDTALTNNVTGILSSNSNFSMSVFNCAVTGYDFESDGANSNGLQEATTEFAVSDVEPILFANVANYPQSGKFKAFDPAATRTALTPVNTSAQRGFQEVFGVFVNNSVTTTNLSSQDLAAIFTRGITDWGSVPTYSADGLTATGFNPAGAITICRREPGSGTQVHANAAYLGQACGSASSLSFATQAGSPAGTVLENTTTSALNGCMATAGTIGISVFGSAPAGTHFVSINGVFPNRVSAALGTYPFVTELTYTQRAGLATSNANGSRLATILLQRGQAAASMPNNASTVAIPGVGGNTPVVPVSTTAPVALGTKSKNTCAPTQLTN